MDIKGFLTLFGGLALFLYGMKMMSDGLEAAAGDRLQLILEKLTIKPHCRCFGRRWHYGCNSKLFRDDGNGCRLCECRYDDIETGGLDYHGCQYWHNGNRSADCAGHWRDSTAVCFYRCRFNNLY